MKLGRAVPAGERLDLPVGAVVSAIGYRCAPMPGLPFDAARGIVANDDGRIGPGLYAAGWCRRGPQGVIPANRVDALAVADLMASDLAAAPGGKPGPEVLDDLLAARGARPVSFADWQRIGAAEIARSAPGRPREKFTRIEEMLGILME